MSASKLTPEQWLEILELKRKGLSYTKISRIYGVSENPCRDALKKLIKLRVMTQIEYYNLLLNKPKLNEDIIKNIIEDRKKGASKEEIIERYGISEPTMTVAMNNGVKKGYLTEQERKDLVSMFRGGSFGVKVKLYGEKRAREMCSDAWHKGMGNNHAALTKAAKNGGLKTQEKNPYVQGNLKYAEQYGNYPKCIYNNITFDSKGEMWTYFLLKSLGYIKKIKEGTNFQAIFGRKKVDFLLETNGKIIAVEYHPYPKNFNGGNGNISDYRQKREKELAEFGFKGKLVILEKRGGQSVYEELKKAGLIDSINHYFSAIRTANQKLENALEIASIPF